MVWPYGVLQELPQFPDTTGYGARTVAAARGLGFHFLGWAPDLKGPIYKVSYGFLVSPTGNQLAIVASGTILNMKLAGTWLYTVATDGRVFYSTDNQACIAIDISRQWKTQLVRTSTFDRLVSRHEDLMQAKGVIPRCFNNGRVLEEFRQFRADHYQHMARAGQIEFTDVEATRWRYTIRGALKLSFLNYTIGMVRGFTHGRFPRCA
jgi:hypothetical protein